MKMDFLPRLYAFAMSAFFATVTTAGLAVMMASSGERARMDSSASAAAPHTAQAATPQTAQAAAPELTRWQAAAADAKRVL